jgi:hypothetical protein
MKIMLDNIAFSEKPKGYEIGMISNRIINCPVDINVEELANALGSGKTIVPATFISRQGNLRRSIENWYSQQVIALDFDEGLTLEEAYEDSFFRDNAVFLYQTFSHTEQHHKFRVVFVLDEPVSEYKHFETIINELLTRYPYADQACKDGSRLFFGGTLVSPFSYENRLKVQDIINVTPLQDINNYLTNMSVARVQPPKTYKHANNIELIKSRNISQLQERLGIEPVTLTSNMVIDYIKRQDLRVFLGLASNKKNFIDIFHDEANPSASIYQSYKGNGHWLYKCFSTSHPFIGTIIHVVQKLLGCSIIEAKRFLIEVFKITIYESEAVKEFKESIDMYKEMLRSDELEEIHPNFYKVFNRYGHLQDLYMLLDLTKEFITNDTDPRIVFYHSIRTLAKHFGRGVSPTGTRLNFLTFFQLIKKLNDSEVPKELLAIQQHNKRSKGYQYRNSTYELPIYTYEFFCQIDEMCKIWLEKGCTSRTVSYEGIFRTFGSAEAERVFPQDKGKEIAELNEGIVSNIVLITLKLIEYKGWTTEKEVLDCLFSERGHYEFKKGQFKRCIGEMLDAYELELISTNKKVKEEMGITEVYMSKQSFPKIIKRKN